MNILLTGSNGFVGQAIAARIKQFGRVTGLGRNKTNQCMDVSDYICADLGDRNALDCLKDRHFDTIIHAAANLNMSSDDPAVLVDNVMGTYYLTRMAVQSGVSKFIYISSLPVVGTPEPNLIRGITEESKPHPETVYHISKLTGEYLVDLLRGKGIEAVSLRIPSPIGRGMSPKTILSVFLQKALKNEDIVLLGQGTRRQNYVDVRDIAEAVGCALDTRILSSCYNVVARTTISNKELAERCVTALHSKSEIIFQGTDLNDSVDWRADGAKAEKELGFVPRFDLEQTIEWMLSDRQE